MQSPFSPVFPLCPKSTNLFIHSSLSHHTQRHPPSPDPEVQNTLASSSARQAGSGWSSVSRRRMLARPRRSLGGSFFHLHIRHHALTKSRSLTRHMRHRLPNNSSFFSPSSVLPKRRLVIFLGKQQGLVDTISKWIQPHSPVLSLTR